MADRLMTVALFLAKQHVVKDLRAKGLRLPGRAETEKLTLAWIKTHPDLIEEAKQWIARSR